MTVHMFSGICSISEILSIVQVYVDLFTNLYNGIFIQKNILRERSPIHIHLSGKPASLLSADNTIKHWRQ